MKSPVRLIAYFCLAAIATPLPISAQEWDSYQVFASPLQTGIPSKYSIYGIDTKTGSSELVKEYSPSDSRGILGGEAAYNPKTNSLEIYGSKLTDFGAVRYDYNLDSGEVSKYTLTSLDGLANLGGSTSPIPLSSAFGQAGESQQCTQVGSDNGSITVCPPSTSKPKGIYLDNNPLIGKTTNGEIHIGENSLITIEEDGRQKLYAEDADGKAIPIDVTEGSDLLINGTSVMGSINDNADDISTNTDNIETNRQNISTNTDNIETNRKNINDLGYGVAGATALTAALSSLPIAADDAPFSCGVGTGGYSSRFAVGIGCAARLNERLSINVGGSHVFGGSSDYGGGSLDTIAARGGFVFKLGAIHKPSDLDGEGLQSQLDEVKQENASIREANKAILDENKALIARLERLEEIALGQKSSVTKVSLK